MRYVLLLTAILISLIASPAGAQTVARYLALGDSLYGRGEYEASARAYDQAFLLGEASPLRLYNAACSWALAGKADEAFRTLDQAVDGGYRDADWMLRDQDLTSLHGDARWKGVTARCRKASEDYLNSINRELYEMFQADQADRRGDIDWKVVGPRDEARRMRAMEMVTAGDLSAPDDFVHAAFIFQHGADSTSYRLAHDLAMKAVALDSTFSRARWIAAASWDRYLQSVGRPQIYGTQAKQREGVWTLEPIDTTAVTDDERARWGVPPLATQRAWAEGMNAPKDPGDKR